MQKINRKINCFYDLNYFIIISCCIISMIKIDYTSNIKTEAKTSVTLAPMAPDDPRRRFYEIDYGLNIKGSCKNSTVAQESRYKATNSQLWEDTLSKLQRRTLQEI